MSDAPDGTLYVVDFYRGVIQDRASTTIYLRDHILSRKLDQPTGLGRIYRVVHETTRRDTTPALSAATPAQLVAALAHPNGWRRDTAQRLLVERGASPVVTELTRLAETAPDPRTRLHALWTLDGIDRIQPATVTKALADASRDVRMSGIRLAERWMGEGNHPIQAEVLKRLDDADWSVRHQLAASLGTLPSGPREIAVVALLERHANDPVTMDAALSGLRGSEAAVLEKLLQGAGGQTSERETAITMLASLVVRGAQDAAVQNLFAWMADARRPAWQSAALLRGAEVALTGAPLPGLTAGRRGGAAGQAAVPAVGVPCPTCPGGRAGPGGAYAFSRDTAVARRRSRPERQPTLAAREVRPPRAGRRPAASAGAVAVGAADPP